MTPAASSGNRYAPLLPHPPVAAPREQAHAGRRSRSGSGTIRVRTVLLAAVLALPVTVGVAPARADIPVAVVGPMSVTTMTGQYAAFGEEMTRGAEMAVRDVNDQGGVNGQPLKLRLADDAEIGRASCRERG